MHIVPTSSRVRAATKRPITRDPVHTDRFRVLLIKPNTEDYLVGYTQLIPTMDLLTVAACIDDHDVKIVDMRLEENEYFEQVVQEFDPHVIGFSGYSAEAEADKELARRVKAVRPDICTIQGGYHATMAPEDVLLEPAMDFVLMGEAETTLPRFLETLREGRGFEDVSGLAYVSEEVPVFTPASGQVEDLDSLNLVDWSLVEHYMPHYHMSPLGRTATMETTRGCPFVCSFCSVWVFNERSYRKKSPERVLMEINNLPEDIQLCMIVDDEFWVNHRRARDIAELLDAQPDSWAKKDLKYWAQVRAGDISRHPDLVERWSAVGMKVLFMGLESVKEEELDALHNKKSNMNETLAALDTLNANGVEAWAGFIVNPEWEQKDFDELKTFVQRFKIAFPQFTVLTPLPGTPLMNGMIDDGKLDPDLLPPSLLDFVHSTLPTKLPLTEFYKNLASLYSETGSFSSMGIIKRLIRNGVIPEDFFRTPHAKRSIEMFRQLENPESYLKTHEHLGHDVSKPLPALVKEAVA